MNRLALILMKTQHWYKYEFQKKKMNRRLDDFK